MSISISQIILLTFSILFLSSSTTPPPVASAHGGETLSAYEVLQSYDFPEGLLPEGVTGYDLDTSSGKFNAYLNGSCSFSLEGSYQLKYKSTISGYIAKDRLTSLTGISVKVLFLWLNIVDVVRSGDELEFSVGIASANFGIDNFEICPQCGCGLDCNSNVQLCFYMVNLILFIRNPWCLELSCLEWLEFVFTGRPGGRPSETLVYRDCHLVDRVRQLFCWTTGKMKFELFEASSISKSRELVTLLLTNIEVTMAYEIKEGGLDVKAIVLSLRKALLHVSVSSV
ncbi:hypothetical protein HYC85_024848 [Camellia sinensis]|uniref:Uncharacterized protein n=1 Tax=Camellia sinensis TaxID=4442 RepID=A0A7J7G997_CAMSI|nr:hypothetical protein HYC85_024848 [Camellia sinensis]